VEQEDYPGAGNPLERLKSLRKNAGICARTHGLRFLLHKVSNLYLGSLRAKSQRRKLTITFRRVSETGHPWALALCIRWRIFSDTWICIARICNGLEGHVEDGQRILPFFYRNVLECVRYFLRQIAYRDDLVYAPRREYEQSGPRLYAEMHTADWWWDVQVLPRSLFYVKAY